MFTFLGSETQSFLGFGECRSFGKNEYARTGNAGERSEEATYSKKTHSKEQANLDTYILLHHFLLFFPIFKRQ